MAIVINLLGSLEITVDGTPSPLVESATGTALLAHLLITAETQPRAAVAEMLWETTGTAVARSRLRELLSRAKKWLPGFHATRATIAYHPTPDHQIDLYALRRALNESPVENPADRDALDRALHLYRGDLLARFYLPDNEGFNEWLTLARERLRRRVHIAYEKLCRAYLAAQQPTAGAAAARRWVGMDDLNETAYRYRMRFLHADGDPAAALRVYEQAQQVLHRTLGIDPAPETAALAQHIRDRLNKKATAAPPQTVPAGTLPPHAYLPYHRNPDFVGREETLQAIAAHLQPGAPAGGRAVGVSGMAGIGKTQLAVEFAYRYGHTFPGGVFWLSFATAENVPAELAYIGGERGMGLYTEADNLKPADRVGRVERAWQEPIPRLLIFDNCESVELLARWLPVSGGCRVLVTARRRQWPRHLPVTVRSLSTLSPEESGRFLQQFVPRLTAEEARRIGQEVGRLPLALHLAAGFLERYPAVSTADYIKQLRHTNPVQHPSLRGEGGAYSPTGYERHVADAFAVSIHRLQADAEVGRTGTRTLAATAALAPGEPVAQALLRDIVVGAEGDWRSAVRFVTGLERLSTLGLVRVEGERSLTVHRLVVACVRATLDADLLTEMQTAVEETFLRRLTAEWERLLNLRQPPVPLNHLRWLTDRALDRMDERAAALANYLGRHLTDDNQYAAAEPYLRRGLAIRRDLWGEQHEETAVSLTNLGTWAIEQKRYEPAGRYFSQAAVIIEQLLGTDHPRMGRCWNNLAVVKAKQHDYTAADTYYQRALALYRRQADDRNPSMRMTLRNMGLNYSRMGRYRAAQKAFEDALAWQYRHAVEDHVSMSAVHNLGFLLWMRGNYGRSRRLFRRVLTGRIAMWGHDHWRTHLVRLNLANLTSVLEGKHGAAVAALQEIHELFAARLGQTHFRAAESLTYVGYVYFRAWQWDEAERILSRSQELFADLDRKEGIETLLVLADVYAAQEKTAAARAVLEQATVECDRFLPADHPDAARTHPDAARTQLRWAEWHHHQGETAVARQWLARARPILQAQLLPTHVERVRLADLADETAVGEGNTP